MTNSLPSRLRAYGALPGLRRVAVQPAVRRRHAPAVELEAVNRLCHELKTPLGALMLFAQMIANEAQDTLGPQQRDRLQSLEDAGQQILRTLSRVLDDARCRPHRVPVAAGVMKGWRRPQWLC